mmetsp:Transcript_110367/g.213761  ORF Transcript_110367/g.213761 Transcript_110367/m.213761 type:complete len:537 (+) Transcript_110367:59-1669(+)
MAMKLLSPSPDPVKTLPEDKVLSFDPPPQGGTDGTSAGGEHKLMRVCVCGAGNGAQAIIAFLASQIDRYEVSVFAGHGDEAARLQKMFSVDEKGITVIDQSNPEEVVEYSGKPAIVTKNPADVIPFADVIVVVVPGFALQTVFTQIEPHVRRHNHHDADTSRNNHPVLIFTLPGQGSANLVAENVFGEDLRSGKLTLAGVIPMPVNARIQEWGRVVDLSAFKPEYWVATVPAGEALHAASLLEQLMLRTGNTANKSLAVARPVVHPLSNYLAILLHANNPNLHPGRSYRLFYEKTRLELQLPGESSVSSTIESVVSCLKNKIFDPAKAERFYEDWDDESSGYMQKLSDERLKLWKTVCEELRKFGKTNTGTDADTYVNVEEHGHAKTRAKMNAIVSSISEVPSIFDYLTAIYRGQIRDTSSLTKVITTNAGLHDLKWERDNGGYMKGVEGGWQLDTRHPFFAEDIPEGVIVYKGIAELAGLKDTPLLDDVLRFFQALLGKEYILDDGSLRGRDVATTKAPQAFGITTFEQLVERAI